MIHNCSYAGQEKLKKKNILISLNSKQEKTNSYREKIKTKIITLLHKKQFVKFKVG